MSEFQFTTGGGSALLYYGDEFVAKFNPWHVKPFAAILAANKEMDAFTKHVGASTFKEAVDVSIRTNACHMDELQKAFDQVKALSAELAELKKG